MIADWLTKALTAGNNQKFVIMMRLAPFESLIWAMAQKQLTPDVLQALIGQERLEAEGASHEEQLSWR
jgi:hypothetical protein